jgi:CRP-like cAMP-binding protein
MIDGPRSAAAMSNALTEQLKNIPLFHDLPERDLIDLASKVTEHSYDAGEALVHKGETGDSLFLIVDGTVKIVSENAQGEELILNQCGPGETIGEMSLFDQSPRSASVVAISTTRALELNQGAFTETVNQRPELSLLLIRSISSRLRFATTYIEKAIDWSQHIAQGDYSQIMADLTTDKASESRKAADERKAGQLLSAFFKMVQEVKAREDQLRQEVRKLTLEIDEARRKQQVEEVTGTEFYAHLKSEAARLRRERNED